MTFNKIRPLTSVISDYDLIMFDLWGVIIEGTQTYAGVVDIVNNLMKHKDVAFITNSPRLVANITNHMNNLGLNCSEDQMFTSGQFAKYLLETNKIIDATPSLYHINTGNYPSAIEYGMNLTQNLEEANILLLTCQLDEGEDLTMFNSVLEKAAKLNLICVCSNPDTIITNMGKLRYCPRYFAEIYSSMGGRVVYTGKPGKALFIQAINSFPSVDKKRVLMVGDTIDTDILGANNVGIDSALVTTGNISRIISGCNDDTAKLNAIEAFCKNKNTMPKMIITIA